MINNTTVFVAINRMRWWIHSMVMMMMVMMMMMMMGSKHRQQAAVSPASLLCVSKGKPKCTTTRLALSIHPCMCPYEDTRM